MTGANSWAATVDRNGALNWTSDAGTLTRQTARSIVQRIQNLFFKLFPLNLY